MTRKSLLLTLTFAVLGGCAAQTEGAATDALVRSYERDGQWLEMSIDAEGSSQLTLIYGADGSATEQLTVDAANLRVDDEPTEDGEALLTFFELVRPDFLDEVRSDLLDPRDDEVSLRARAALLDFELMTLGPEYKAANTVGVIGGAASTLSFGCWNGVCGCSGDADCNNMFLYACADKPYAVCYGYGSILRCYCSVRPGRRR